MPKWLRLSFIRSWVFWAIITLGISGGLVYLALGLILNPNAVPNCPAIFVPMSSASLRVYCGQLAASKQTLPDLVAALNLVKDVAPNDPTRSYVDSNIQRWSLTILRLAEATYQDGNYDEAVKAAKNVPSNVPAYKIVAKRLAQWQETWNKGVKLDRQTRDLLNSSKWVNAYAVAVKLTRLNNRYWATTKYQELADLVQIAKADSAKLDEARQLVKTTPIKNLLKAIEISSKIAPSSFAHTEAQTIISTAANQMLRLAKVKLDRQDWQGALDIAAKTPETAAIKTELQDLTSLAQAQSHAVSGSIAELETAISLVQSIQPASPMYARSQQSLAGWQLEIQDLATLQRAQSVAATGNVKDLQIAITEAQRIPTGNPRGKEAAQVVTEWRKRIETVQDTPYLRMAQTLSASGTVAGVQSAIAQLNQIRPGRALYPQAQQQIQQWTADIQRAEDSPILAQAESMASGGDLTGAVAMAQRIGRGRAMSAQSQERVRDWQAQLQAASNLAAAQKLAETGTPEALLGAIQAAARIPRSSNLRDQARLAMDNWSGQMLEVAQSTATTNLRRAIAIARVIPDTTSAYSSAQALVQQWQQQLNPPTEPLPTDPDNSLPN
ncbi:chromosome segregation ATPase [Chamaesiphon sp.]|uniref:chromosome segregation ATPase n=1 Tax=Chamaesiphon sp. TaxID=2814140 RepID=UPI00359465F0